MSAENGKTPQPGSSTELNLESTTYTFTLTAGPLTPSGNVREIHERVTRHIQVEEEEGITMEEVEEVEEEEEEAEGEEDELEVVAAMAFKHLRQR